MNWAKWEKMWKKEKKNTVEGEVFAPPGKFSLLTELEFKLPSSHV